MIAVISPNPPGSGGGGNATSLGGVASAALIGYQTLTDASTIAWDASQGPSGKVLLTAAVGANRILGLPTNLTAGIGGCLKIVQSSTGSNAMSFASGWKFPGGIAPTLSTANNAVDFLSWTNDGTNCYGVFNFAFA